MTRRLAVLVGAATLGLLAVLAGLIAAFHGSLPPPQRRVVGDALREQATLLVGLALLLAAGVAAALAAVLGRYATAARRLAAATEVVASVNPDHELPSGGAPEVRELAGAVERLARRHRELRADVDEAVRRAAADVERERNRLAALMAELGQPVIVCNADGRILLYNAAARELAVAEDDGRYVGLGRSIFGVLDRDVLLHALAYAEDLRRRGEEGAASFATHIAGRLVRARVTPVREQGQGGVGFVLVLDDVTREAELTDRRAAVLQSLIDATQRAVASIRVAVEAVGEFGEVDPDERERLLGIAQEEAARLSTDVERARHAAGELVATRWGLEPMRADDVLVLARRAASPAVGDVTVEPSSVEVWLEVDGYAVARAVAAVAERLAHELGARELALCLRRVDGHARFELRWLGGTLSPEALRAWEDEPLLSDGRRLPFTLRQVLDRHGAEAWSHRDPDTGHHVLCVLLPAIEEPSRPGRVAPGLPAEVPRPAFYDFDLFAREGAAAELESRPLAALAYTVFDTETTGLDPVTDEIVALGAVRIVNGRLLSGETFDQLVDPGRPVPPESTRIHGISTEAVAGQPDLRSVLPRFARFADDTVLVGHNVAFDMRFLAEKEEATGVAFTQPVLDTLLLGPVVHPDHDEHSLEALAARLGVSVLGRHTALGDALVTAEVFLAMTRLLPERGITTLGQALEASRRTYNAQVSERLYGPR